MGEKTNTYIRSKCTDVIPVVRKRSDTNELWYTIPYHLHPNYTKNKIHGMYWYTRKKEEKRKKKKARRKRNENTQKIWNGKERKRRKQALRAQAESLGDKVAVCWYDQFCDVSI